MFERILIATDGSSYALRAAGYAFDIAKKYKAATTLLYVAELPPVIGIPPTEERIEQTRQELSHHGREALRKTREAAGSKNLVVEEQLVFGSAVPDILRCAREGNYDLIVIGSRGAGTGGIEQMLIGSVAEGVLHGTPCPVLMVRLG